MDEMDPGAAGPQGGEPHNQDPEILSTVSSGFVGLLEQYGWYLLAVVIVVVYLLNKFQGNLRQWQEKREDDKYKKMDGGMVQSRMEAMERARMKMQEELNQQAREFAAKQEKREEEKRQARLEDWDRHQEGRGYRNKTKATDNDAPPSSSSGKKPSEPKKRLRPEYNPLMADYDTGSRFRPAPRGGAMGGGG